MLIEKHGTEIRTIAEWKHIATPKAVYHWQPSRSTYECANAWCASGAPAVPEEVQRLLGSHPDTRGCQVISAIPEHRVVFDGIRGEPRNSDLVALATRGDEMIAISIESKADEPFSEYAGDVAADALDGLAHGENTGRLDRLRDLAAAVLPPRRPHAPKLGRLRYQLLTATAGALAYAIEARAARALIVIHEFVTPQTDHALLRRNEADLNRFVTRLSAGAVTRLVRDGLEGPLTALPRRSPEAPLFYIGKARRNLLAPRGAAH